jgi:hypothetical protein
LHATEALIPVGVVSRNYKLIQHRQVITALAESLEAMRVDAWSLEATLSLTTYGERMALSILLPDEERFSYQLGTDDGMRLRVECFNSVERSTKLVVMLGWFRFVCLNGLVVGKTVASLRGPHTFQLSLDDVSRIVLDGLGQVERDKATYDAWRRHRVTAAAVQAWVDGALMRKWGTKAAARTYSICLTGEDVDLTAPFEKAPPSQRQRRAIMSVPGAPECAANAMDVAQALSWVAGRRRDLSSRTERRAEIPSLIEDLTRQS